MESDKSQVTGKKTVCCTCEHCGHSFEAVPKQGHRLMCGDATNPDHVDQLLAATNEPDLIHTAPPITPDGDDVYAAADAYRLLTALLPEALHIWWRANHYAAAAGLDDMRCWLAWTPKTRGDNDEAVLAWTTHDGRIRTTSTGKDTPAGTWPEPIAEWALDTVDRDRFRSVVLDPFARTGWTLLAAHATGRTFAGLERDPAHVDTACRRFQQATGIRPERLHPDGGREPVDFTT